MTTSQLLHTALLYADPDDLVTGALPFIHDGLAAGEPVLVAVPEPNLTLLRAALGDSDDGVRFVDMARAGRNPAAIIPWVLHPFLAEHPSGHARIIGEPIWSGRTDIEYPVCVQHEALINVVLADHSATILCPYDLSALPPDVIAHAEGTHPRLGTDISAGYADPSAIVASFNQPLPAPPPFAATLTFRADDLREVRAFVLKHADLPTEQLIDLEMAVNELATNAVAHTPGPGTIRIWAEPGRFICDISDPGPFTNELAGRLPPSPSSGRGRGLLLANHVCDLVRRYSGPSGTTIRLHVRRP
jgi:anti-sigma regulatory factor (Ser/Thr protein kinase)